MMGTQPQWTGYEDASEGRGWVPATLKSASVVTGFVLVTLAAYRQTWALAPVAGGAALAAVLLWVMDLFIRRAFTPERAWAEKLKDRKNAGNCQIVPVPGICRKKRRAETREGLC
jgi:hypothetical protein